MKLVPLDPGDSCLTMTHGTVCKPGAVFNALPEVRCSFVSVAPELVLQTTMRMKPTTHPKHTTAKTVGTMAKALNVSLVGGGFDALPLTLTDLAARRRKIVHRHLQRPKFGIILLKV